jgi:hypothetical protein
MGNAARMEAMENAYKISVGKQERTLAQTYEYYYKNFVEERPS